MLQLNLTPQEAFALYGLLEGSLNRFDKTNVELNNPELIESIMTDIMIKIIHQLEKNEIISKID